MTTPKKTRRQCRENLPSSRRWCLRCIQGAPSCGIIVQHVSGGRALSQRSTRPGVRLFQCVGVASNELQPVARGPPRPSHATTWPIKKKTSADTERGPRDDCPGGVPIFGGGRVGVAFSWRLGRLITAGHLGGPVMERAARGARRHRPTPIGVALLSWLQPLHWWDGPTDGRWAASVCIEVLRRRGDRVGLY
ncbi:unnamed protein product [Amoebophrya sp. A120]|nr:unnamed protein product [Amoebophrya sp. A120]|eukprot:GSA120T00004448001.1